jgi:hypothetical protein
MKGNKNLLQIGLDKGGHYIMKGLIKKLKILVFNFMLKKD